MKVRNDTQFEHILEGTVNGINSAQRPSVRKELNEIIEEKKTRKKVTQNTRSQNHQRPKRKKKKEGALRYE